MNYVGARGYRFIDELINIRKKNSDLGYENAYIVFIYGNENVGQPAKTLRGQNMKPASQSQQSSASYASLGKLRHYFYSSSLSLLLGHFNLYMCILYHSLFFAYHSILSNQYFTQTRFS